MSLILSSLSRHSSFRSCESRGVRATRSRKAGGSRRPALLSLLGDLARGVTQLGVCRPDFSFGGCNLRSLEGAPLTGGKLACTCSAPPWTREADMSRKPWVSVRERWKEAELAASSMAMLPSTAQRPAPIRGQGPAAGIRGSAHPS